MAQDRINEDVFRRLDAQDAKLDKIAEDVAYMRGMQDAHKGAPIHQESQSGWMNKNNVIAVALAGLISTVAAVIGKLTGN